MRILILINDAPYGTEKAYNAFRLAMTLQKEHKEVEVLTFIMADAVGCAVPNQNTPQGYYNIERMLKSVLNNGGQINAFGSCLDARGLGEAVLADGVEKGNMKELAQWTVDADKVFTF